MSWTDEVLKQHPWLTTPNQKCLLSPDSDGFISGLLLTNLLNWQVVGFYDGKVMAIRHDLTPAECAFVDIEVNREVVGSIGHHIISYNNRLQPLKNFDFPHCIQPNELRAIDGRGTNFQHKYPFGTSHLLITLLHRAGYLKTLSDHSTTPLLFTDGVWNNVFGYTENCLDWLKWLGVGGTEHPLTTMFMSATSIHDVMTELNAFLRMRDGFNAKGAYRAGKFTTGGRNKRTGVKLKISTPAGHPLNFDVDGAHQRVHSKEQERIVGFIEQVASMMELPYRPENWTWEGLRVVAFEKDTLKKVNNTKFSAMFELRPLSLAMTSGTEIEYTLDPNELFSSPSA